MEGCKVVNVRMTIKMIIFFKDKEIRRLFGEILWILGRKIKENVPWTENKREEKYTFFVENGLVL